MSLIAKLDDLLMCKIFEFCLTESKDVKWILMTCTKVLPSWKKLIVDMMETRFLNMAKLKRLHGMSSCSFHKSQCNLFNDAIESDDDDDDE